MDQESHPAETSFDVERWTDALISDAQRKAFEGASLGDSAGASVDQELAESLGAGNVTLGSTEVDEPQWVALVQQSPDLLQFGATLAWGMVRGFKCNGWQQVFKCAKPLATHVAFTTKGLFPLPVDLRFLKEISGPPLGFDPAAAKQAWCGLVAMGLNLLHGCAGPFPCIRIAP